MTSNRFAFILGRQAQLAVAEILSRLEADFGLDQQWSLVSSSQDFLMIDLNSNLNLLDFFLSLGGAIKLVQVFEEIDDGGQAILAQAISKQLLTVMYLEVQN